MSVSFLLFYPHYSDQSLVVWLQSTIRRLETLFLVTMCSVRGVITKAKKEVNGGNEQTWPQHISAHGVSRALTYLAGLPGGLVCNVRWFICSHFPFSLTLFSWSELWRANGGFFEWFVAREVSC